MPQSGYTYHEFANLPGFSSSGADGINNLGLTVGFVYEPASQSRLAVIWDSVAPANPPISLGVPPGSVGVPEVTATAINDLNEIVDVGKGVGPAGTIPHYTPYRWTPSTGFVHLKPVVGPWNTWSYSPRSINCAGNVVGSGVIGDRYLKTARPFGELRATARHRHSAAQSRGVFEAGWSLPCPALPAPRSESVMPAA